MTAARALAMASSAASRWRAARKPASSSSASKRASMRALSSAGRDQAGERRARLRLEFGGKTVLAPGFAHRRLRAGAVAMGKQRARQRKPPFGGARRLAGEKGDDRLRIGLLLPQRRLGAPAQRHDARPARIGGDERGIAGKIEIGVVAAQDHPFDQLARQRIGNGALDVGRFVGPALVHEIDRLLDGGEVERRGGRRLPPAPAGGRRARAAPARPEQQPAAEAASAAELFAARGLQNRVDA